MSLICVLTVWFTNCHQKTCNDHDEEDDDETRQTRTSTA